MEAVRNAKIPALDGNSTRLVDITIKDGVIAEILPSGAVPASDDALDAKGMLLLPGAVDPHVHFDTPGYTDREDFSCGSMEAASGGVTCVIDMPDTSVPPVTSRKNFQAKLKVVSEMSVIDFALWGGISGNSIRQAHWKKDVQSLIDLGVVGFKTYLLSGMREFENLYPLELVEAMKCVKDLGSIIGLHAEDRELVQRKMAILQTAGRFDPKAYYECRMDPSELNGVIQGVSIASETRCPLHIVHLGSAKGLKEIVKARSSGADLTCETCAHFLAFSFEDLVSMGAVLKTAPVVKTGEDSAALWNAICDGTIDFVASDHAPCRDVEKNTGSIWTDYAGNPGTGLMFPYVFSEGYSKGRFDLARLVELTSSSAAKRFGLYPKKGAIEVGSDADFMIVDENKKWTVKGSKFFSKGHLTPFEGREFTGKVVSTICRGSVVYDHKSGFKVSPGYGKFVDRKY